MICPNCGRRNGSGATFCSRCRQRLPLAGLVSGQRRRAAFAEPKGGGGAGAVVLGVALLAGMLFIGGAAAVYLSSPQQQITAPVFANASVGPTLEVFVQATATPAPTAEPLPTPMFPESPSPFGSFPLGSFDPFATATPTFVIVTPAPTQNTGPATAKPPRTASPTRPPTDPPTATPKPKTPPPTNNTTPKPPPTEAPTKTPRPTCNANGNPPGCKKTPGPEPTPTGPSPTAEVTPTPTTPETSAPPPPETPTTVVQSPANATVDSPEPGDS